jgi:integrase
MEFHREILVQKKRRGDGVATGRNGNWAGGFVRRGASGLDTYVIERHVGGAYFKVSTRCHTEEAALAELARWEKDPYAYRPGLVAGKLEMTDELVFEYCRWMREEKGNTKEWANVCRHLLADWLDDLAGLDLRSVTPHGHLLPALRSHDANRRARVTCLKGFFRWLRVEKGLLRHAEDASLDMSIPKHRPSRLVAPRDVPADDVRKVAQVFARHTADKREAAAREQMLDTLALLQGTGWHVSEVRRFVANGEIRADPTGRFLAVLVTWHKRKEFSSAYAQNTETLEAAKRLKQLARLFSNNTHAMRMAWACREAGVTRFDLGDMRHSVSTWAAEDGADQMEIAKALNHSSPKTTRDHYIRQRIPLGVMRVRPLRVV